MKQKHTEEFYHNREFSSYPQKWDNNCWDWLLKSKEHNLSFLSGIPYCSFCFDQYILLIFSCVDAVALVFTCMGCNVHRLDGSMHTVTRSASATIPLFALVLIVLTAEHKRFSSSLFPGTTKKILWALSAFIRRGRVVPGLGLVGVLFHQFNLFHDWCLCESW